MSLGHEVILASAGAGKTYRLANRIVRLLADGAKPGEIVALTFTRKAAAEFVARVLTNLARAAASDTESARLADAIGRPELARSDFARLLAGTVEAAHRLRFGTMDAFFQSLVRTHPLELGLPGGFTLLDERRASRERKRILRALLRGAGENDEARDFLEAFRLASFGKESRGAAGLLGEFAGEARDLYRESGDAGIWGDASAVWPQGSPWLPEPDEATLRREIESLASVSAGSKFGHGTFDRSFGTLLGKLSAWTPGTPVAELGTLFNERLMKPGTLVALLHGEPWEFEYSKKKIVVPASVTAPLGRVVRAVIGGELRARLRRTAGAGRLIAKYDALYESAVIRSGLMSFSDILHTLALPKHAETLAQAAYRLDGRVKHWLFDEFQDTAREAWRVLATNAGEAIADASGERSVFFVGDVKQALYGWNGGDHTLLPELVERHALPTEDLDATQRCGPQILELVNAVCGAFAGATGMPEKTGRDWYDAWHPHRAGVRAEKNTGYAALAIVDKPKRDEGDPDEARLAVVLERIREGDFLRRGLSCGVLTSTNAEATAAAEYFRKHGLPAMSETDTAPAEDNPVTLALLALVRHAAHPGDTLAAETVAMTPLGAFHESTGGTRRVRERLLATFAAEGAEAALREVLEEAAGVLPTDAFSQKRVRDLLDIAREYDAGAERDPDAFGEFAAGSKRRDTTAAGRVQVMTIHKSKGLEFDAVFLPFLEGGPIDELRRESFIALRDTPDAPPRAVLAPPPAAICEADPVLREALDTRRSESAYENLCLLYVALTRAKRELLLITHPAKDAHDEERAPSWRGLLTESLGGAPGPGVIWSCGDSGWVNGIESKPPESETAGIAPAAAFTPRVIARAFTPSGAKGDFGGDAMPEGMVARGKEFGTEVHRIFEALERIARGESEDALKSRLHAATTIGAPDKALHAEALDHAIAALRSPEFRAAFEVPAGATVRTELPFALLRAEDELFAGTFDRVVIGDDTAMIYDFKTDACAPASLVSRYAEPMRLYRAALARLLGMPEETIRLTLLHTPTGRAVPIE